MVNLNMMLEEQGSVEASPRTFYTETTNRVYEHYLDYALEDFSEARQLCVLLRNAGESDSVVLRINSPGGRFDVAAQIINAIRESKANVTGVIEQECASAATMIFLSCDQWQVQPWGEMMIHYTTYGAFGKGNEVTSRVGHVDRMFPPMFRSIYENFLTDVEISDIIRGLDLHLTQEDILCRLKSVVENIKKSQEEESINEGREELEEADQCLQVPEDSI